MTSRLFTLDELKPPSVERLVLVGGDDLAVELDEEPPRGGAPDGHHNLLQVEPRLRWSPLDWLGSICWFILHFTHCTN